MTVLITNIITNTRETINQVTSVAIVSNKLVVFYIPQFDTDTGIAEYELDIVLVNIVG